MFRSTTTVTRPDRDRLLDLTGARATALGWALFADELRREIDRARVVDRTCASRTTSSPCIRPSAPGTLRPAWSRSTRSSTPTRRTCARESSRSWPPSARPSSAPARATSSASPRGTASGRSRSTPCSTSPRPPEPRGSLSRQARSRRGARPVFARTGAPPRGATGRCATAGDNAAPRSKVNQRNGGTSARPEGSRSTGVTWLLTKLTPRRVPSSAVSACGSGDTGSRLPGPAAARAGSPEGGPRRRSRRRTGARRHPPPASHAARAVESEAAMQLTPRPGDGSIRQWGVLSASRIVMSRASFRDLIGPN